MEEPDHESARLRRRQGSRAPQQNATGQALFIGNDLSSNGSHSPFIEN
jgi:hypothetical protein